jgi:hypothetical protein
MRFESPNVLPPGQSNVSLGEGLLLGCAEDAGDGFGAVG